jgi:hypothetical protein
LVFSIIILTVHGGALARISGNGPGIVADPLLLKAPLEPERIAPQTPLDLPNIQTKSGNVTFLQYDALAQGRPCTPVVVLDVPQFYVPRSPAGPTRTWQVLLLVRFSHEDNSIEPATPELFGCVGHCDGRMTLLISNGLGEKEKEAQRVFHATEYWLNMLSHKEFEEVGEQANTQYGYKKYAYVKTNPHADAEYYSDTDDEKTVSYALQCDPHVPVPHCKAYFSIPDYRWINVQISFDMLNLPIWERIRDSVIKFVSAGVRQVVLPVSCQK